MLFVRCVELYMQVGFIIYELQCLQGGCWDEETLGVMGGIPMLACHRNKVNIHRKLCGPRTRPFKARMSWCASQPRLPPSDTTPHAKGSSRHWPCNSHELKAELNSTRETDISKPVSKGAFGCANFTDVPHEPAGGGRGEPAHFCLA